MSLCFLPFSTLPPPSLPLSPSVTLSLISFFPIPESSQEEEVSNFLLLNARADVEYTLTHGFRITGEEPANSKWNLYFYFFSRVGLLNPAATTCALLGTVTSCGKT